MTHFGPILKPKVPKKFILLKGASSIRSNLISCPVTGHSLTKGPFLEVTSLANVGNFWWVPGSPQLGVSFFLG